MVSGHLATVLIFSISGIVVSRIMGPEVYGTYAAVTAVLIILSAVASGGLHSVENRFLSPLWQAGDRSSALGLGSAVWTAMLVLSAAAGLVGGLWLAMTQSLGLGLLTLFAISVLGFLSNALEATRGLFLPIGEAGKMIGFSLARVTITLPVIIFAYYSFGLEGVFWSLPVAYATLLFLSVRILRGGFPVRFSLAECSRLRPHLGYAVATLVAILASVLQARFGVFALAAWLVPQEAAFFGVALLLSSVGAGALTTAQRSLMPILGELEAAGDSERLRIAGSLMTRFGVAAASLLAIGWAFLGRDIVPILLTESYSRVIDCATALLFANVLLSVASTCYCLLSVRLLASTAAVSVVVYAAVTGVGLLLTVRDGSDGTSFRLAIVYVIAALAFSVCAYASLGLRGRIWLPLRRTSLLALPAALVVPISAWDVPLLPRLATFAAFLTLYAGSAVALRLMPLGEVRQLLRLFRRLGDPFTDPELV